MERSSCEEGSRTRWKMPDSMLMPGNPADTTGRAEAGASKQKLDNGNKEMWKEPTEAGLMELEKLQTSSRNSEAGVLKQPKPDRNCEQSQSIWIPGQGR